MDPVQIMWKCRKVGVADIYNFMYRRTKFGGEILTAWFLYTYIKRKVYIINCLKFLKMGCGRPTVVLVFIRKWKENFNHSPNSIVV